MSDLFKAKTFLRKLDGKVREIQEEINAMKTRMEAIEENTDYTENAQFNAVFWEQINESERDEEEIAFKKPNLIMQGVRKSAAQNPRIY